MERQNYDNWAAEGPLLIKCLSCVWCKKNKDDYERTHKKSTHEVTHLYVHTYKHHPFGNLKTQQTNLKMLDRLRWESKWKVRKREREWGERASEQKQQNYTQILLWLMIYIREHISSEILWITSSTLNFFYFRLHW